MKVCQWKKQSDTFSCKLWNYSKIEFYLLHKNGNFCTFLHFLEKAQKPPVIFFFVNKLASFRELIHFKLGAYSCTNFFYSLSKLTRWADFCPILSFSLNSITKTPKTFLFHHLQANLYARKTESLKAKLVR